MSAKTPPRPSARPWAVALLLSAPLAWAVPTAAGAAPAPLPAAVFARLPLVSGEELSPDGTHMAFRAAFDGKRIIAVVDLDQGGKPVRAPLPDDATLFGLDWANDDHLLLRLEALRYIARSTFDDHDWYIQRAFGMDARSGKVTPLLKAAEGQNAAELIQLPHDGSAKVLMAAQQSIFDADPGFYPTVFQVDAGTGEAHRVLDPYPGVFSWTADADGQIRAGVGYEDSTQRVRLLYRSEGHGNFRAVDRADARQAGSVLSPFLLLPHDHALALRSDASGNDQVREVDLLTLEDVRTVYAAPAGEVTGPILDRAGTTLLGVYTSSIDEPVHWLDEQLAKLQARFASRFPGWRVQITSLSADRQRMLVRVSAADRTGVLFLYDVAHDAFRQIAQDNKDLPDDALSPVKVVHYAARDGLEIEAIATLPASRKLERLPMIVFPHGGPWAQDRPEYDYIAQFLASRGYLVLQPNFRGSTGYGDAFLHKGDGQLGLAMQDDLADGVQWAVRQGLADPSRVCIVGASYGGYAAMWGLVHDPGLYRCAISISGVSSLKAEVWRFARSVRAKMSIDAWKRMTPDFAAVSPINSVEKIRAPLLLVHGEKDSTVGIEQSQDMYARMGRAHKDVEFVPLKLADHYFLREPDRTALLEAMEAFLAKHNPAD